MGAGLASMEAADAPLQVPAVTLQGASENGETIGKP